MEWVTVVEPDAQFNSVIRDRIHGTRRDNSLQVSLGNHGTAGKGTGPTSSSRVDGGGRKRVENGLDSWGLGRKRLLDIQVRGFNSRGFTTVDIRKLHPLIRDLWLQETCGCDPLQTPYITVCGASGTGNGERGQRTSVLKLGSYKIWL